MSNIAIKVEKLSKAYQLGQIGTGTISRDLERWYARLRGKEDPFLTIGRSSNHDSGTDGDMVWSLKDINFEVEQGNAIGIIGKNGAGKSTLLKILSRVTSPTTGKITGKGRIASLLEVGTGFHPELTGRENIYLNGTILGMRKHEINRQFDTIVDFAGISRYVDTPVKRYSSGMYVRLAFAVAAHLESEILIVDEVLAVGDAEFQRKCLGKMDQASKTEGKTILFVSHNMNAISAICKKGILLEKGTISYQGDIQSAMSAYHSRNQSRNSVWYRDEQSTLPHFKRISYTIDGLQPKLSLNLDFIISCHISFPKGFVAFGVKSALGNTIMEAMPSYQPFISFPSDQKPYRCVIELNGLVPGLYSVYAWLGPNADEVYDWQDDVLWFEIETPPTADRTFSYNPQAGSIIPNSYCFPLN